MNTQKEYDLKLTTKTWDNDSHILIDYENQNITKKTFTINSSGFLSRINNKITFTKEKNNSQKLLEVIKNEENNKYKINCGNWSKDLFSLSNETGAAYMLYKTYFFKEEKKIRNKFYKLSQGDILKLGRIYIKLLDMQLDEENTNEKNDGTNIDISSTVNDRKILSRNSSLNSFNSFNSSIFKGQEIIKGTFLNDRKQNRVYNLSNIYNLKNEKRNNLLLSCDNKYKNRYDSINNNLKQYNNFFLPRINSCEELFLIKPITKLKIGKNNKNLKKGKKYCCRICYGENSIKENPLISPCTCKGSMKYIHYLCLKNCINSKIESEIEKTLNENTITYNKKDICCDICRSQFPDYIRYNGILFNISFYKPKFREFIMFEILQESQNEKAKYISIVSLDNKKRMINIGRSKECEFSIQEVSLSRFHSIIHRNKSELYIEDNKSKFGTLILVQNDNIEINNNIPLKLQIDRTYIKIKINTPLIYSCCNAETNNEEEFLDYQIQNKLFLNVFAYFNIKDNNDIDIDFESNSDEEEKKSIYSNNQLNMNKNNNNNIINLKENKIILISNEDNETNEKNNFEKNYFEKINNIKLSIQKEGNGIFKNKNNEKLNSIQLYKKSNKDNIKSFETNNISSNISKTGFVDSSHNTPTVNNKKSNINLMIEDCNNKNMIKNGFRNKHTLIKLKKKIKITNNQKYLISNEEYLLPKITNDIKPFANTLHSSININNFQSIKSKFNTLFVNESNINNDIFNLNKNKPKIINKHNVLNSFMNSNKI